MQNRYAKQLLPFIEGLIELTSMSYDGDPTTFERATAKLVGCLVEEHGVLNLQFEDARVSKHDPLYTEKGLVPAPLDRGSELTRERLTIIPRTFHAKSGVIVFLAKPVGFDRILQVRVHKASAPTR